MSTVAISKKQWVLVAACWFIAQLLFLHNNGIVTNSEAGKYIAIANRLAAGNWSLRANDYLYAGYIALLLLLKVTGLSYKWMYLVQLITGLASLVCFTSILQSMLSSRSAIAATAILYGISPIVQPWNCFLFTDALFLHLMIITVFLLVYPFPKKQPVKALIVMLLLLPFFRPIGFLCTPLAISVWLIKRPANQRPLITGFTLYFLLVCSFLWYCFTYSPGYFYPNHNSEANIICGYPSSLTSYITIPWKPGESIVHFFIANPSMTWRLFTQRLFKAFWMTRPYFSQKHNLYLSIFLPLHYCLALLGMLLLFTRKLFNKQGFVLIGLLVFTLPLITLCADWVNRFVLPSLVFVYFFIGMGADFIIEKCSTLKSGQTTG